VPRRYGASVFQFHLVAPGCIRGESVCHAQPRRVSSSGSAFDHRNPDAVKSPEVARILIGNLPPNARGDDNFHAEFAGISVSRWGIPRHVSHGNALSSRFPAYPAGIETATLRHGVVEHFRAQMMTARPHPCREYHAWTAAEYGSSPSRTRYAGAYYCRDELFVSAVPPN